MRRLCAGESCTKIQYIWRSLFCQEPPVLPLLCLRLRNTAGLGSDRNIAASEAPHPQGQPKAERFCALTPITRAVDHLAAGKTECARSSRLHSTDPAYGSRKMKLRADRSPRSERFLRGLLLFYASKMCKFRTVWSSIYLKKFPEYYAKFCRVHCFRRHTNNLRGSCWS